MADSNDQRAGRFITPPRWMIPHISRSQVRVYRRTDGRIGGSGAKMRHLLLTSIGRRSGSPHTVCLPYWLDAEGQRVVVASFSGAPRSPAWYHNVADRQANPTVAVQDRAHCFVALAEVLGGDDYAATWVALTTDRPFFADYQKRTQRRIPLVRLSEQRPTSPPDEH